MRKFDLLSWAMAVLLVVVLAPTTMAAGLPDLGEGELAVLDNGRDYIRWNMVTEYERVHLTLSTPCGVIERTYQAGEDPVFEVAELAPDNPTGSYNWQLRIEPHVDPSVREALNEARAKNDQEMVRALRRKGLLPKGPFIQSGFFSVDREGGIVDFTQVEKEGLRVDVNNDDGAGEPGRNLGVVTGESIGLVTAEQVISGDLTVYNSICVGFDCPTNPSFGADTIRLQENNLRIHVDDTSTAGSYPNQDWRLEFNSNVNGGGEYFRVIDATANRSIMTIEANAPSHSLYVESSGEVGIGTANPVLELHAVDGDTPGLRIEQDVSSGFAAQVWDLAGNETSFFLRDATNGSTLPFRVRPGAASNSLVVDTDNDVGVGVLSPSAALHVKRSAGAKVFVEDSSGTSAERDLIELSNAGNSIMRMENRTNSSVWRFGNLGNDFQMTKNGSGGVEFRIFAGGDATFSGEVDAVAFNPTSSRAMKENFSPVDNLEVLRRVVELPVMEWEYTSDEDNARHLGPFAEDFQATFGLNGADNTRINLTDLGGVALAAIQGLNEVVSEKDARIQELEERLSAIEAQLHEAQGTK